MRNDGKAQSAPALPRSLSSLLGPAPARCILHSPDSRGTPLTHTSRPRPRVPLCVSARARLALCWMTALLVGAPRALAQSDLSNDPKESFARGYELVQRGEFEAGIVHFERAYLQRPHYSVLYNLAQAYASVGRIVLAVETFERYLRDGGAEIPEERRSGVERALAHYRRRIGHVRFAVKPENATISLDGRPLGPAVGVQSARVEAGRHVVRVALAGYVEATRTIDASGGEEAVVALELERELPMEVLVRCAIPDVTVRVNDAVVSRSAERLSLVLPATRHTFEFTRSGYVARRIETEGRAGARLELDCALRVDSRYPEHAALTIRRPEGTSVWLDGVEFAGGAVPPGRHRLELAGPSYERLQQDVLLRPREQRTVTLLPEPTAEARARAHEAAARTRRIAALAIGGTGVAAAGAALALYLSNNQAHERWNAKNRSLVARLANDPDSVTARDLDALIEDENAIRNRDTLAVGLSVAGGTLVLGAVALVLWPFDAPTAPRLIGTPRHLALEAQF
nr:MAG: hypothetical protein DIU78_02290 [Pseudomonadota bacterium]